LFALGGAGAAALVDGLVVARVGGLGGAGGAELVRGWVTTGRATTFGLGLGLGLGFGVTAFVGVGGRDVGDGLDVVDDGVVATRPRVLAVLEQAARIAADRIRAPDAKRARRDKSRVMCTPR